MIGYRENVSDRGVVCADCEAVVPPYSRHYQSECVERLQAERDRLAAEMELLRAGFQPASEALTDEIAQHAETRHERDRLASEVERLEAEAGAGRQIVALLRDREKVGRLVHESWSATKRGQGFHGPDDPCLVKYNGRDPLNVIVPCRPADPSAKAWIDTDTGERVLGPYPDKLKERCRKFHADLIPWGALPEGQKDINRCALDAVLAELAGPLMARDRAMAIPCESCARLEAEAGRALAEALTAAREDPGLYRLGQDQATAWEHGSAGARKSAESDAEAIHAGIDAALAAWGRAAAEGGAK